MTFEALMNAPQQLLLKTISGSHAYNLAIEGSDTDLKGIFILPEREFYGLHYTPQVSNSTNDEVFFEIGRLIELLCKNNPNILELLNTPAHAVLFRHPLMDRIKPGDFLSQLCMETFAGYAKAQIKKASGLNKKINKSFEKIRKSVTDFCYVVHHNGTLPLAQWLQEQGFQQETCGLTALSNFRDGYLIYHHPQLRGIVSGEQANDVQLSSIPKGVAPLAVMTFNKDAYSVYCREYLEYWEWVENRNELRYQGTLAHGKSYDAKNMMHTFRLLSMAEEIALYHEVRVHREDRDLLLRIRRGEFEYATLIEMVHKKLDNMESLYAASGLPVAPDTSKAEDILVSIREDFYKASRLH
ncbi:MAG: nucleotidyltransferase domain-containing protein [Chitinophaga sp.]|uniref:DNA polymerase beta superfamily protein n=1 Tax=Chitinophaga sp. TaxID=1869181 RepID=UPI0025BBABEE|nr:nucleotidyltransferase domain-containing protein [Chitinophaga sp.]MBV8253589.1 nucleotidyltransferase domain-containing protein [Chitinophaga sp.]